MRRVLDFVNDNKKIIIVVVLIIILVGTIYFINGHESGGGTAATKSTKSSTEIKLTEILSSIDGVGATDVMINQTDDEITGVIIVCEGADRIMTRNDILNAVSTALNIEKSIIAIYSMKA